MNVSLPIVVDESCADILDTVAELGPASVFRRNAGLLSDPVEAAQELHGHAKRASPDAVIYVAASFAAFTGLQFANRWPESLAGLVFLDASHPRQSAATLDELPADLPDDRAIQKFRQYLQGFGPLWELSCTAIKALGPLGPTPLIVLAAGDLEMPDSLPPHVRERLMCVWHSLQRDHAARSSRGELRILPNCGHNIAKDNPRAVYRAVKDMIVALGLNLPRSVRNG